MAQQNLTRVNAESKVLLLNDPANNKLTPDKKTCRHRNESGWCSKSQGKCSLLNYAFIKL